MADYKGLVAIHVEPDTARVVGAPSDGRDARACVVDGHPYETVDVVSGWVEDGSLPTPAFCSYDIGLVGFGLMRRLNAIHGVSCEFSKRWRSSAWQIMSQLSESGGGLPSEDPGELADEVDFLSLRSLIDYRGYCRDDRTRAAGRLRRLYQQWGLRPPCKVERSCKYLQWARGVVLPNAAADAIHRSLCADLEASDDGYWAAEGAIYELMGSFENPLTYRRRGYLTYSLMYLVGVGAITASVLAGRVEDPRSYPSGREFALSVGLAPNPLNDEGSVGCDARDEDPLELREVLRNAAAFSVRNEPSAKPRPHLGMIPETVCGEARRYAAKVRAISRSAAESRAEGDRIGRDELLDAVAWELAKSVWGVLCLADDGYELETYAVDRESLVRRI